MDIEQLSYFIALAEDLNYTTASERCYITRQAMRQVVQRLEQRYGTKLIHNHKNRLALTSAGKLLVERAIPAIRAYEEMDTAMISLGAANTSLHIGVSCSIVPFYAPEITLALERFSREHSDIEVTVSLLDADGVIHGLDSGTLDAGLVVDSGKLALPMKRTVLRSDPLRITLSANHALTVHESLALRDLEGLTLCLMSDPIVCFRNLYDALEADGIHVTYRVVPEYVDVIYALRDGVSVAIDRGDQNEKAIGAQKVLPLEGDAFSLNCCLLTRLPETPAAVLLQRYMHREATQYRINT